MDRVKKRGESGIGESEFPSFLPPLMVKELRRGLRTNGFVIFLILFPLLMAAPFLLRSLFGEQIIGRAVIDVVFWLGVASVLLIFNPLRALSLVSEEKKTRTDELIVMTRMTPYNIVWQKWMSLILQTVLLSLIILPFYLLRYFLGRVEIFFETGALSIFFIASCVMSAAAVCVSGMAFVFRIFYCLGLVYIGIIVIIIVASGALFSGTSVSSSVTLPAGVSLSSALGWMSIIAWVVFFWLVCRALLFWASRWFAPPSENTDVGFRKTLLWGIVLCGSIFVLSWFTASPQVAAEVNIKMTRSMLMQGMGALCLFDMIWSNRLKLIHWVKLNESSRWMQKGKWLFLPGWQGAGLVMFVIAGACIVIDTVSVAAGGRPEMIEPCIRGVFLACANYIFLGVVFQPLYKRTGQYSFLVYAGIACVFSVALGIGVAMSSMMPGKNFYFSLLSFMPMGSNMVQEWMSNPAAQGKMDVKWDESLICLGNWTLIFITFLIFLLGCIPLWRKLRRLKKMNR